MWALVFVMLGCSGDHVPSSSQPANSCHKVSGKLSAKRLAQHFASSPDRVRFQMVSQFETLLSSLSLDKQHPFHRLLNYWQNIIEPSTSAVDGRHIPMAYLGDAEAHAISQVPDVVPPTWISLKEPLWNGMPVPESAKVKQYPLFRGENLLIDLKMRTKEKLFQEDSLLWKRLRKLFSEGMSANDKPYISRLHNDAHLHTLESSGSAFLASSIFFQNARDFGRKPGTPWSAMIEFRGDGVNVNEASKYFENLAFLNIAKARFPLEMEVAVNYGVDPRHIRAVWLVHTSGKLYYVLNPNFSFE